MIELPRSLFHLIQEAIWILDSADEVIAVTKRGQQLEQDYRFNLKSILEISRGEGCALHSTKEECLNCSLSEQISPAGFPFVLLDISGNKEEFWGSVNCEGDYQILEIQARKTTADEASFFDYLNSAREYERKKIAQDLHDGIAQSVYSLMLETQGLKWLSDEEQIEKYKRIHQHFSEVLSEIKNMASELRPLEIDEFGLVHALEQFIDRTSEMTGFEIDMIIDGEEQRINEEVRITIYRIIQEAVNNAMKYSGENQMSMQLSFRTYELFIEIKDQGIGFDVGHQKKGFGLANMKERAHSIGSELIINSKLHQGTFIQIRVPLREEQDR
ncbi:sensor histidine kinase [Enterococcus sp.]|uniref:sensor histidine kinase n=1 Tax=Enterococcus sp. TaxID=35783 RepID=UPI00291498FD|nr:sensor histidine kinase [Enterococcus sp.]MDU5337264.1 sensor histidine kinase [Enterococcus sp.]